MVNKNNMIWMDVDGVLLDWLTPFLKHMFPHVQKESITEYDLSKYCGENVKEYIDWFNNSMNYEILKPIVSLDVLEYLKNMLPGYFIVLTTKVTQSNACIEARMKNLNDKFGTQFFAGIMFVGDSNDKVPFIKQVNPEGKNILIEDCADTLRQASKEGITCYGIAHHYNQTDRETTDCTWFDTTEEAIFHIIRSTIDEPRDNSVSQEP